MASTPATLAWLHAPSHWQPAASSLRGPVGPFRPPLLPLLPTSPVESAPPPTLPRESRDSLHKVEVGGKGEEDGWEGGR